LLRALSSRGHEVRISATGLAGLEEVVARRPDVVVLDLGLAGHRRAAVAVNDAGGE
jgi:DNA-binding response OmpR family regulator